MKIQKQILIILTLVLIIARPPTASVAEQTVQLANTNWEPYSDETLPDGGFMSAIVAEAFARVGYRVEFVYLPWKRALVETTNGKWDGLMNVYWTKERAETLDYSDIIWKVNEEFISLTGNPFTYTGPSTDLSSYIIGAQRGTLTDDELRAVGVKTEVVTSTQQNIAKLLGKRVDAVVVAREIFFYLLQQVNPQFDRKKIKIHAPPYKTFDMYTVFSKKNPNYSQLTADFNRGLKMIKADGTFEKIVKEHGFNWN